MARTLVLLMLALGAPLQAASPSPDPRRAAYREKMERLMMIEERVEATRPARRDGPARTANVSDDEVREIQSAVSGVLSGAIVNISTIVTGCPCEDGPLCSDQVWIVAYRPDASVELLLSKVAGHWTLGTVQRWWLEYERLETKHRKLHGRLYDAFEMRDSMYERFPACLELTKFGATRKATKANVPTR